MGPLTGGGFGYCAGHESPGSAAGSARGGQGAGFGRGMAGGRGAGGGMGRGGMGGGRGHRHMYHATGLPGWQRAGFGWGGGGRFGAPAGPTQDVPQDASAIRAEVQRFEETAARLREQADALEQTEE